MEFLVYSLKIPDRSQQINSSEELLQHAIKFKHGALRPRPLNYNFDGKMLASSFNTTDGTRLPVVKSEISHRFGHTTK